MIQTDLWGNATDLSLLVDLNYADLQKLQAIGAAAQAEQAKHVLRDDLTKVWDVLKGMKDGRVDIVLDNAGFELYTDLVLADFLVSCTPFVSQVVFQCVVELPVKLTSQPQDDPVVRVRCAAARLRVSR